MRSFQTLMFRLPAAICAALLLLTLVLLLVTDHQVRSILDQSQTALYQRQIDSVLNSLQLQQERLEATGTPETYQEDFQTTTLRNLRSTYYLRSDQQTVPVIFSLDGKVIMHPVLDAGQSMEQEGWDLERVRRLQSGQFVHSHDRRGKEWHLFKLFGPWNWVVGYAIPISVKYADASRLLRYLALTFFIVAVPIGVILSLFIHRQLKPIRQLTSAAQSIGTGDLLHPLPVDQAGEIGALAQSFVQMRDLVNRELEKSRQRAERVQRQQQALMTLSHSRMLQAAEQGPFLQLAAEQVERTLRSGRVSIWEYDPATEALFCTELYIEGQGHSRDESRLAATDYPAYFAEVLDGQPVVTEDARKDPRTKGFSNSYLIPGQIQSMIDIPIRIAGKTQGVICIEKTGEARIWHEDELNFASAVADLVSQALIQAEKLRTMQEIASLRQELANIVDSMPSILIGIDQNLLVRHWNREAEKATGLDEAAARGSRVDDSFPQLKAQRLLVDAALTEKQLQSRRKLSWHIANRQVYVDLTIYPLRDEGAVIRIDDVTERVQLEEMMVQTEKMLSVGGLAAGMAHEINNPLAGIMQNIQVIRNRFSLKMKKNASVAEECGTDMETIISYVEKRGLLRMFESLTESGSRAARIVDNMLSFSRKSDAHQAPHLLRDLISRTLDLAANDYDLKRNFDFRRIKILREDDADLPEVPCSATEIQQVLLNLIKNAAQAMSQDPNCKSPQLILSTRREGRLALIEIHDNGPGIGEEIRRRIFEPFFTTKGVGVGTGLGLSVAYFIVREKHGGSMEVNSRPGQGTSFIIRLPLSGKNGGTR